MKLRDYQKKYGISRIDFSKVKPVDKEKTYSTNEMICPYCGGTSDLADIDIDSITQGMPVYCGWCEKNFYVEAELSLNTICSPIENEILERKDSIMANYRHLDVCDAHNVDFDEKIKRGNIEWDIYHEFTKPLLENAGIE